MRRRGQYPQSCCAGAHKRYEGINGIFVRMLVLMISKSSSNMGHIGSETRSLGQIEGKSC